jgi:hypothetical protein
MIMRQKDPRAAESSGISDDPAYRQVNADVIALCVSIKMNAARTVINMRDPQHLVFGSNGLREAVQEEIARGIMAGK